ncbi:MAG: repeat-containing protein [Acidobacteria bacterium]|jgi:tetratricopeptide (TPR) repeat protein|nr:repeat-containing protein [Acidobacteriota bacterium]
MNKLILLVLLSLCSLNLYGQNPPNPNKSALDLMSRGDFPSAIAVLDGDIAKSKNLFESYKLRGAIRRMTGDFPGAFDDYDKALALKANEADLYEQRASLRMILRQDFGLILKDLDAAVAYGKKHEKVYTLRANIRRQAGDEAGAIEDYQAAIGLRPDYASAFNGLSSIYAIRNDNDKAISILEDFINAFENSGKKLVNPRREVMATSSVNLPTLSDKNVQVGESTVIFKSEPFSTSTMPTPEQIEKMTEKMEQSKNTALVYINLAQHYERQKNYEKALTTVEKGLRLEPSDYFGYETRGKIKIATGDYVGAIADLSKSIQIMPNMGNKYLDRGIAYLMLGKNTEAQSDFDKFLQMFPKGKENMEKRIAEAKQRLEQ